MVADDEDRFVRHVLDVIIPKLSGTDPIFEEIQLDSKPHRRIIIGTLAPKNIGDDKKTIVNTNSKSVTFLLKEFEPFKVTASLCVFYSVKEVSEGEEEIRVWKRKYIDIPIFVVDNTPKSFIIEFSKTIEEIAKESKRIKPKWNAEITVETEEYSQNDKTYSMVTVTLLNNTEEDKNYEATLFDANLKIFLNSKIQPFVFPYKYEGYNESYEMDFQTNNCSAEYNRENNAITTSHYKIFNQPKILPKENLEDLNGVEEPLKFETLSKHPDNLELLRKIYSVMGQYFDFYKGLGSKNPDLEKNQKFRDSLDNFQKNMERYKEGVEHLASDEVARKAFELMQETFFESNKGKYSTWRLFQVIFIVSLIPDIVKKDMRRDIAELLHVDTGGGKSEAYFGIVLFSAFYDRLSGKEFGATALTKFPLRMVAIQQLQRIIRLFAWAEEIKLKNKIPGYPFSIGYFVGNTEEFPRYNFKIINKIKKATKHIPGKFIEDCPICSKDKSVVLDVDEKNYSIIHRCNNCNRIFRFYYSDDEIYRLLPTFIIATVDKLAGIASNRRFRSIFGGSLDTCSNGHGFVPRGDRCEAAKKNERDKGCNERGKPCVISFSQGPSVVIQDEMHLVKEGFGTIDSHFESFLEHLQFTLKGVRFKNVVMTATVCGARNQIKELYNKNVRVFPGDMPSDQRGVEDFYLKKIPDQNQRILVGLSPNMRDNQFASLLTLKYFAELMDDFRTNKQKYAELLSTTTARLDEFLKNYKNILTYHNKKADVNGMSYYLDAVVNSKLTGYQIKKESLTGELELDEIKDIIKKVEQFNGAEERDLQAVFATNVVSHGVDIKNWNIMIFQGIPRNTSEYIQALSRCGRHHLGLVFLWFYPNMIRDQSFYQSFQQYHEILYHHIVPIPISRWATLGFYQTINSLFCAAILNYFPEITGIPMYKVDDVNTYFSNNSDFQVNRLKLKEFLEKAYIAHANEIGSKFFLNNIGNEIEKRLDYLMKYTGSNRNFFPNALSDCSPHALSDGSTKYFNNQFGMRGIQDTVILSAKDQEETFLGGYKKEIMVDDSDGD